jgi:quercetin dioxygenase-like cupin family protein
MAVDEGRIASRRSDPQPTEDGVMNGRIVNIGQLEIRYLVDGSERGGLGLFEMNVPAGAHVPPPHSHSDNEECVYVLAGVLRYSVGEETRDLSQGEWMSTPRGIVHHFANPGSETARVLVMMTPDIGERYFRDVAAVVNAGGPPDRATLLKVMARYGLVPGAPQAGAPDLRRRAKTSCAARPGTRSRRNRRSCRECGRE